MKKILVSLLLLSLSICLISAVTHPFYVSISQINYNSEAKSLEIACKIFVDDLEIALQDQGSGELYLGLEKEAEAADSLIADYLNKHLKIVVNGKAVLGIFIGKEVIDDVIWSYLELADVPYPRELSIENTLLVHAFENQQNIVHIKVNGIEKSLRLSKGRTKEVLSF